MSRVKIVATLGPATQTPQAIRALVEAGADVVRLNGSHADLEWLAHVIRFVRDVAPEVPILLDLPGGKIRTQMLEHEPCFEAGECIVLTTEPGHTGRLKVPVSSSALHEVVSPGDILLADDGRLRFTVQDVRGQDITCRAETAGTLRSAKGIHLPRVPTPAMALTAADRQLSAFAKDHDVNFVGLSFVETAAQVQAVRSMIGQASPWIIAKIERARALEHLEEILEVADGLMIDRGDLSVETGFERIALVQKQIVATARRMGRPSIVATEMLHSMIANPVPTKAEISDITNAVLDGTSAIMLSSETAIGRFPAEAVATMRGIADAASAHLQSTLDQDQGSDRYTIPLAIEDAVALICRRLPVTKIVVITIAGYAARRIAARLPRQPILAVSNNPRVARSLQVLAGTEGVHLDIPFSRSSVEHIPKCLEALWRCGKLCDADLILVTSLAYPRSGNRMNLIQTHQVADLRESLGWMR